jgi:hypothetical protein
MKPWMLNTENIAVYLIFTLVIGSAFQPYWRTNHDDSWKKNLKTLLIWERK